MGVNFGPVVKQNMFTIACAREEIFNGFLGFSYIGSISQYGFLVLASVGHVQLRPWSQHTSAAMHCKAKMFLHAPPDCRVLFLFLAT